MLQIGDIGFSSNLAGGFRGLLADAIRYFTDSNFSHSFIITDPVCGQETVQEASELVAVVPFDKNYRESETELYVVYRPKASKKAKLEAAKKCFVEFAGVSYGRLQLIWFVYRAVMERVFKKDVRKQKNWMADGVICSELVYWYLWYLGKPYQTILAPWNPDTIQAEDLRKLAAANPHLFEIVEEKNKRK
jgi:hypothetical protein